MSDRLYRISINLLARLIRTLMRRQGVDGALCIGAAVTYYESEGMKLGYNYRQLGAAGNIDSGGASEIRTRTKLLQFLTPNSVFYDVGAHEGLFSIWVKRVRPEVTVHAFEPMAAGLEANLALNGIDSVLVHPFAVGDRVGAVTMCTEKRSSNHVTQETKGSTPMVTIDSLGLEPPTIVKLDVEGFELRALWGARETIKQHRPIIITEINACYMRYHTGLMLFFEYMSTFGYSLYALRNNEFVAVQKAAASPAELDPSDDANYWWLPTSA
jgi:FkbM family methyltransferase